jgi:6-phosphogluconolactonase/glucosamine-6-phosphate isomerase/deaminase
MTRSMNCFYVKDNTAQVAGNALDELLSCCKGRPTLLLLSGGSALSILPYIKKEHLGPNVTLSLLDERYTDDVSEQNFAKLKSTFFYETVLALRLPVIDPTPLAGEAPEDTASRLETEFIAWEAKYSVDKVVIATMGIGGDGHTAGILPDKDEGAFMRLFDDARHIVVGYEKPGAENPRRITASLYFLRKHVDHAIVYVVGENKASALSRLRITRGSLAEMPARIVLQMKDVSIYTDQAT